MNITTNACSTTNTCSGSVVFNGEWWHAVGYSAPITQNAAAPKLTLKIPAITKVHQPTDRVVICTFSDGATTKAVCHPDDKFSLDTAISICVTKYIFEKFIDQTYHRYIKDALQLVERQKKEAEQKEIEEQQRQRRIEKSRARKAARRAKVEARKRQEAIEREVAIQTEVFKQLLRTYTEGELDDGEH